MKLQLQEIKSNLCKELHLNLPSIIDDELVEVEGVALHLGHFCPLRWPHGQAEAIAARQILLPRWLHSSQSFHGLNS